MITLPLGTVVSGAWAVAAVVASAASGLVAAGPASAAPAPPFNLITELQNFSITGQRAAVYSKIQQQLGNDLPHIYLWYLDNVIVHTARIKNLQPSLAGNYDFLRTISVGP